jgi:hypothetical protein
MTLHQLLIQLLHLIIVTVVGITVMISTNKYTLIALFMGIALVFAQALYYDGCLLSKVEGYLPFINRKPNDIIRSFFGLKESDIKLNSLEKILIGFTLLFVGLKLTFIVFFEHIFKNTYYNQICIFLGSRKKWYERLLANYMN